MSKITYTTATNYWQFLYPTVTVTQTSIPSAFGYARMSTRYVYTVRSVLVANDQEDLKAKLEAATEILGTVGGIFKWEKDNNEIIEWGPDKDANFGPHPGAISFEKFFSTNSAIITWQLEVEVSANVDNEVVDLVYTTSHSLDKNFYTIRNVSGVLRMNGAKFQPAATFDGADCYRNTIEQYVCSTPDGWQRTQQQFNMSTDGLTLTFSITDEQQFAVLPEDITDGDANLSITGNPRYGTRQDFTLEGFFEAPADKPRAPRQAFVLLAQSLFNMLLKDESFRVKELSMRQDIYRPRLHFRMVWHAWSPQEGGPLEELPGDTNTQRRANWMLFLLTRADDWLAQYKGAVATSRGAYGTTEVRGWCGSGAVTAPVLVPTNPDRGSSGSSNPTPYDDTIGSEAVVVSKDEQKFFYEYSQSFKFFTDHNVKILPYKNATKVAAAQQTTPPATYLVVTGKIVQHGELPVIPEPPYSNEDAWLLRQWTHTEEPKDGPEYTVEWKYLMRLKTVSVPELKFPYTPFLDPEGLFDNPEDPDNGRQPTVKLPNITFENDFEAPTEA